MGPPFDKNEEPTEPADRPITADSIERHLPYYLTLEHKQALANALARLPDEKQYFAPNKIPNEMLQGDCWDNMEIVNFNDGQRKPVRGIILSNSCDVDKDNKRDTPTNVLFSPIVKLSSFVDILTYANISEQKIASKVAAIKNQLVTSVFYIPDATGGLGSEYLAMLDNIHTIPSAVLDLSGTNRKLFTLNTLGFYVFIFKLSVHFCRLGENVDRS
jgi:hypothetical protein